MKTRANWGRILIAVVGVALGLADAVSAAPGAKDVSTSNQKTGAIAGRLTGAFGNEVVSGANETVTLTPLPGGQAVATKTDAEGRFVFQNLPPGQYELRTRFEWTTSYIEVFDDGTRDRMYADHSKQLVARVQVKAHQTARVTTFSEGETRDTFYAYGGTLSKPHHPVVSE
jgi:hypothetical protein